MMRGVGKTLTTIALSMALAHAACARPSARHWDLPGPRASEATHARPHVDFVAAYDLPPADPRCGELSGIAWSDASRTLYAVSDRRPMIVPLIPNTDYRVWKVGEPIAVTVAGGWDGEGIAATPRGFFVTTEIGPHLYELDRSGATVADVAIPPHFAKALRNRSLESLSLTPDGQFLFITNETALEGDGPQPTGAGGTTVRIWRHAMNAHDDAEFAYRTDPVFASGADGEMGVADLCALSKSDLLVLERSYVPTIGNAIRLYRAQLAGESVLDAASIADAKLVEKTLIVDLASFEGARIHGSPLHLPNYEGLALGPLTAQGDRLLFVISDDNGLKELVTRILVLSIHGL